MVRWKTRDGEKSQNFVRKSEAEQFRAKITSELFTGTYVPKSDVAFGPVAEEWFANVKVPKLKPSSRAGERSKLDNQVLPKWRDVLLSDITHRDVQAWVSWLATNAEARKPKTTNAKRASTPKPLSGSTAVKMYRILDQVLDYAVRTGRLAVNPAKSVELPRVVNKPETAISHEEVAAVVAAAARWGESVQACILTLTYTAVRFGELASLRVGDVDLQRRRILVDSGFAQVQGEGLVEDSPKTHKRREVPILTDEVGEALERQVAGRNPEEFLFPAPDGGPMRNSWLAYRLRKAYEAAGMEPLRIKTLRHTGGSLGLALPRADVATVSKMMGHSTPYVTYAVYAHSLPGAFDRMAEEMNTARKASAAAATETSSHDDS